MNDLFFFLNLIISLLKTLQWNLIASEVPSRCLTLMHTCDVGELSAVFLFCSSPITPADVSQTSSQQTTHSFCVYHPHCSGWTSRSFLWILFSTWLLPPLAYLQPHGIVLGWLSCLSPYCQLLWGRDQEWPSFTLYSPLDFWSTVSVQ